MFVLFLLQDISAIDIVMYNFVDALKRRGDEFLKALPKLTALMAAVEARPKIAKWIAERPVTEN